MLSAVYLLSTSGWPQSVERGVSSELRGKTLDLKSAYRQLPVSEDHLKFSHFVVPAFNGKKLIFKGMAMPFGSIHSHSQCPFLFESSSSFVGHWRILFVSFVDELLR